MVDMGKSSVRWKVVSGERQEQIVVRQFKEGRGHFFAEYKEDVEMSFTSSMKEWLGFDCWEMGGRGLPTTGPLLENAQREEGSIPLY